MENVYSHLKIFHFPEKLQQIADDVISPPLHIRLKPINACNHTCWFCCYRTEDLFLSQRFKLKDMIPQEKMREIIQDMDTAGVRAVTFTGGGEPMIYPYFVESVESLLERGIKVAVLTNGARLDGEAAEVLGAGASWVRVSIDAADGATLAESRKVKLGEFDLIVKNLEKFSKLKNPNCELGINYIVTQKNAVQTFQFLHIMKEAGVNHVKVSECVVGTKAIENNLYHEPHFTLVKDEIAKGKFELEDDSFHIVDKFHDFDDKYDKTYTTCPFIRYLNVIGADQVVYMCQDKAYSDDGFLGSIKDRSLLELWESDEYAERIRKLNPAKTCNHHCVQHGKNLALLSYLTTDSRHLEFM